MSGLTGSVLSLAACGLALTLLEGLLPRGGVRNAAKCAIGLLFLAQLAQQIRSIIP